MTAKALRQFTSLMAEIVEEEERRERLGAYSLFGDDHEVIDQYRDQLEDMAAWIQSIDDSLTRRAFKLRYIDRLPWAAVSVRLGYTCDSGARMLCARHLAGAADSEKRHA